MEVDGPFGLREPRELKAVAEDLARRRRRKSESRRVPALELTEPTARADLRLKSSKIALGEHDSGFDILKRCAFGGDPERDEIAAERRSGAAGDHEQRMEAAGTHCTVPFRGGAEVLTA